MQLKQFRDFPYFCSKDGKIYRTKKDKTIKNKPLSPSIVHGYQYVNLYKEGKQYGFNVHTIVAECFINNPNPKIYTEVDHINRNRLDNNIQNLRWVNRAENLKNRISTDIQIELKRLIEKFGHQKTLEILKNIS